ncbi:MAG TPA: non-homologous end-joining DNA ligase [Methylomirabilota bacterium]|nr:non-homologous end-joining DNA ligase [Methylomirabilota bacterium]
MGGVTITHPDKVWWPDEGITKLDVARFYADLASRLLPWMSDRPLAAERCPDGMRGECFFQKNFARGLPPDVPTAAIAAESTRRTVRYVVGGARKTLLAMVNLGCIAVHVMNCRTPSLEQPDWLAFDLDPGSGAFADAAKAGRLLRELLDAVGLRSYPKTSGGRGLHVLVPLRPGPEQDAVRAFALALGRTMAERSPGLVTVAMAKPKRRGRVFVDVLRNAFGQTIVAPYSVRRRPRAPISTPLDWDEVDPRLDPARYNLRTFERRLAGPDPWADFWRHRQALPEPPATNAQTSGR